MSEVFNAAAQALSNDPALRERVMSASSAEERAQILRDAGVQVPTHAEVNSGVNALAGVAGGGKTTNIISATVPAAVPAASAACGC